MSFYNSVTLVRPWGHDIEPYILHAEKLEKLGMRVTIRNWERNGEVIWPKKKGMGK